MHVVRWLCIVMGTFDSHFSYVWCTTLLQPEAFMKVRPRCEAPRRDMVYPMNYVPCRYLRISCLRGNPIAIFFIQVISLIMRSSLIEWDIENLSICMLHVLVYLYATVIFSMCLYDNVRIDIRGITAIFLLWIGVQYSFPRSFLLFQKVYYIFPYYIQSHFCKPETILVASNAWGEGRRE